MSLPLVAIVGRPNVGKSTLVNRIAARREAIVDKQPGVTRDRNYLIAEWGGVTFSLIDTGGLVFGKKAPLSESVSRQALLAVEEGDVIIFVVDGKEGMFPEDKKIAEVLRAAGKPVLLVVNKVDQPGGEESKYPFYELALGEPYPISALHGIRVGDLLDKLTALLTAEEEPRPAALSTLEREVRVAIVGRPNVGKSSLLNCLLGEERVIVDESPGTTRDAIDTICTYKGKRYCFIDTAGLRRRARVKSELEYYGLRRALKALDRAQVALVVLDGAEGVVEQDQKIASLTRSRGCGSIVVTNKWDLLTNKQAIKNLSENINRKLHFISYAPLLRTSALTSEGVAEIYPTVDKVAKEHQRRLDTAGLNNFIQELLGRSQVPARKGKKLKVYYGTQVSASPPSLVFFVNYPQLAGAQFRRFLENSLREYYGFVGCPLWLKFKKKS